MASKLKGRLEGRVAIVTGASRGIGRATAQAFAREGASVVVNFHRERSKAEEVVEDIKKHGGSAILFQADVSDRSAVERMVEATLKEFEAVDILVNNAGVYMGGGSLLEFNEEEYDPMWRVNVKGVLNCTRAVAPHMIERKYGSIVSVASDAGRMGEFRESVYGGCKGAVIAFTKAVARETGRYGIRLNVVCPGLTVPTGEELGEGSMFKGTESYLTPENLAQAAKNYPLRRLGRAQDVANAVVFLASDSASFVTGQTLSASGGYTMM